MYPSITDMMQDLFGWGPPLPIQTFGFFVALAFIAASWFFAQELKRKEANGLLVSKKIKVKYGEPIGPFDYITSGVIGFLVGFKLLFAVTNYQSFVDDPQHFLISIDGSLIGGLIGAAISVAWRWLEKTNDLKKHPKPIEVEEERHPYQHVGNMTMIAAFFGLAGAKVFHLLENPNEATAMFESVDSFFSGLTMYGGLIVGGGAVIFYAYKNNLTPLHVMDACAPPLMLAYGIGRVGCQMSGDGDWGIENPAPQPGWLSWLPDWSWAYGYPHNVISDGVPIPGCEGSHCYQLDPMVWPTPLYESVASIGLFVLLWSLRKRISAPGAMFSLYLLFNGFERFWIEKIRVNTPQDFFGMTVTQAEIISTGLFVLGVAGYFYFTKRAANQPIAKTKPKPAVEPDRSSDEPKA